MLVPQEPEIFSSTIKENITLGLPTKAEEIKRVIKLARFNDVVAKLPKGLKSVINEKGVNLSGGQKQRLALARALLFAQDKQVLLLDESTSSVDPENEAHIYEDIFKEYKSKTILASIHKMNLLKYFDRIVMFEDGKIVDEGSFRELLSSSKKFKRVWEGFVKNNG
jgi:ABC-type multidrug transport system fused ATPase/permease subunit